MKRWRTENEEELKIPSVSAGMATNYDLVDCDLAANAILKNESLCRRADRNGLDPCTKYKNGSALAQSLCPARVAEK